jgi:diguanylate cyclase (GGDEF)-like protein/PAS domain S-box-containing protein
MKRILIIALLLFLLVVPPVTAAAAQTLTFDFTQVSAAHGTVMLLTEPQTGEMGVQSEAANAGSRTALLLALSAALVALLLFSTVLWHNNRQLKAQNQRLNSLNQLRTTFIDADDRLIYLKDENLKYLFVNKAFERFYQRQAAEVIGRDDFALSEPELAQKLHAADLAVLEAQKLLVDEVFWQDRVYQTRKFPVQLDNGQYGVGAYVQDVTAEYSSRKDADKVQQRNAVLVDVLSKDFKSAQEQLDYVLQESLKLTGSEYGYLFLYDAQKEEFNVYSWSQSAMAVCRVREIQRLYRLEQTGLWGEVVRQRRPIIVNDYPGLTELKRGYPAGHVQLANFMSVPVIIENEIVAVVGLANKPTDYDENDVSQITLLMQGVWNAKVRRETQAVLAVERKKYLLTLLSIGDGVMVVDQTGKIEMLNKAAEKLTGWSYQEAVGRPYQEVFKIAHELPEKKVADPIAAALYTNQVQQLESRAVLTSKEGRKYFIEDSAAPIIDDSDGHTIGVVLVFKDVTEKEVQRRQIEYLSFHDSLTGLYNRRFFEEEMNRLDTIRNLPIAILMGDVNGLKLTNDIFGHAYGDLLLQRVAVVLKKVCRADDIIARWGGDEFVLLLPKTTLEQAEKIKERIKQQIAQEEIKAIKGSIALGCGVKEQEQESIYAALDRAEHEMYLEKTLTRQNTDNLLLHHIINSLHTMNPLEKAHADRVSELCVKVGRALQLPEQELRKLKEAGYLHDIGKVALEDSLLNKGGELLQQDWQELKLHPVIGFRILNSFENTMELAEYVLNHHERLDGTGYPQGLQGPEIPKLARIIALAETYDAMTNAAPYRRALSKEEALQEIKTHSGTHFDPEITAVFLKVVS